MLQRRSGDVETVMGFGWKMGILTLTSCVKSSEFTREDAVL